MKHDILGRWRLTIPVLLLGTLTMPLTGLADSAKDIVIKEPYVRAVPPGQPNSAAFMKLGNSTSTNHAIVGAKSDAAQIVELHTHVHEGGMMKMRQVDAIEIPAQGETELKPGGLHVMLIGLQRDLVPGESVTITLDFADGSSSQIQAPVKKLQMQMGGTMKH